MSTEHQAEHRHQRDKERRSRFYNKAGQEAVGIVYRSAFAAVPTTTATIVSGSKVGIIVGVASFGSAVAPEMLKKTVERIGERFTQSAERAFEQDAIRQCDEWIEQRRDCLELGEATVPFQISGTGSDLDGRSYPMPVCLLESFRDEMLDEAEKEYLATLPERYRSQYLQAKSLQRPMLTLHRSSMSKNDAFRIFHAHEKRIHTRLSQQLAQRLTKMALRENDMSLLDLELSGIDLGQATELPTWWDKAGLSGNVRPVLSSISSDDSAAELPEAEIVTELIANAAERVAEQQAENTLTYD